MEVEKELCDGLYLIRRRPFKDDRGVFERVFCPSSLEIPWGNRPIQQVNRSFNCRKGTFRGFHFQLESHCEMKFVQCVSGAILDIVIDIREGSETFMQSFHVELSSVNSRGLVIPEGFAHGFLTLEDNSEVIYFHSKDYCKEAESGINLNDPLINVVLPFPVLEISERDKNFPFIKSDFFGIKI